MILAVWTLAATVGSLFSIWNIVDAYLDWRSLPPIQNGRRLIARGELRRELFRLFIQGSWALIGVVAWLNDPVTTQVSFVTLLLIGTNVAVAMNTLLDAIDRHRLHRILGIAREVNGG